MDEPAHGATAEQVEAAAERIYAAHQTGDPDRAPRRPWRGLTAEAREYYRSEAAHYAAYFYPASAAGTETER